MDHHPAYSDPVLQMIYDKTRALEPGYYDQFSMVYKPALEKDRKDAESWRALVVSINAIVNGRTTEPLLVAPPLTMCKAESTETCHPVFNCPVCLNPDCDDYDLTSNDTRRGD